MSLNRIEQTFRRLVSEGRPILKLFSGNPNEQGITFPSPILEEVYVRYFKNPTYRPDPKGLPEAREAIQGYYERGGVAVDPKKILLTSGTSESFSYLFSLLARPGDNILAPKPGYPLFDHLALIAHVELRNYPLREETGWTIDFEALQRLSDDRTRALILISPHNPTGRVFSAEEIQTLVVWTNRRGLPLICDEVFSEFVFEGKKFPRPMAIAKPKLCFTLNGISKMLALPALKLGWIVVTGEGSRVSEAVDALETTADTFLSVHTPVQMALPRLLSESQSFLTFYRDEVARRRRLALEILGRSRHFRSVPPEGGFYLIVRVEKELDLSEEEMVIQLMEKESIFVHPGYFYDTEEGIHLVISFLTRENELRRGLEALVRFLLP